MEILSESGEVTKLCQSYAIARYIAKTIGMYKVNTDKLIVIGFIEHLLLYVYVSIGLFNGTFMDNAMVDMIVYCVEDYIVQPCVYIRREQDETKKVVSHIPSIPLHRSTLVSENSFSRFTFFRRKSKLCFLCRSSPKHSTSWREQQS